MIGIYHSKDLDGLMCGALMKRAYPDIELIGWDYGDPIPELLKLTGEDVIMADVSFPMDAMEVVAFRARSFVWVDHHKSAYEDYLIYEIEGIRVYYDASKAACQILWEVLFEAEIPLLVDMIGRYDVWNKEEFSGSIGNRVREFTWEDVLDYQYGLRAMVKDVDGLLNVACVDNILALGAAIRNYQHDQDMRIKTWDDEFEGLSVCVKVGGSPAIHAFSGYDGHDACITCYYDGKYWKYSFRTEKDIDLSTYAKRYGGGGHPKACGFRSREFLFPEFIDYYGNQIMRR